MRANVYAHVTDTILGQLDKAGQWKPCWIGAASLPSNAITGNRYRGINVLMLWCEQIDKGYAQDRWATYRQWQEAGCQVREGERSTLAVYFDTKTKVNDAGDEESYRLARSFRLFNAAQVDGERAAAPPMPEALRPGQRFSHAEEVVAATGARIQNVGVQPCYSPTLDLIRMPLFERFLSPEGYYGTMFHELAHWTGHKDRLARDLKGRFDKQAYGMEELVAELSAAFVCAALGIRTSARDDHAAYLQCWLDVMRKDAGAIVTAAAAAGKAADFILAARQQEQEAA